MNLQQTSGIVISAGFVLYVAAMVVAPQLYNTEDISQRFAVGAGVPAIGFLLLALSRQGALSGWLYWLGAAVFAGGSGIGVWLVHRQTLDPAAFWEGTQIPLLIGYGFLALTLAGMLGLGIAMLQGDFPNWLGYLVAGSAVTFLIVTLVTRGEGGFFISVLAYLVTFLAGIVIWRG